MTASATLDSVPVTDLRRPIRRGVAALALLAAVFGGWAGLAQIEGAVVSGGQIVVAGKPQLVQSLDGGIVREIAVRSGDRVQAGDVLVQLDATLVETNLGIARVRLADALALRARLESEQAGLAEPVFRYPELPFARPATAAQEEAQRRIFAARAEVLTGGQAQLQEALRQSEARIDGLEAQIAAKREQAALLEEDLANARSLNEQGLVAGRELNDITRSVASIDGEIESLEAEIASVRIEMEDARLATLQKEREFRESVASDLREASAQVDELMLEIVTRSAELERTVVRSPAEGVVHDVQVATLGGVIAPGATLLQVVPLGTGVEFELRVDPRAIDQVHPGQPAEIVIAPLDPATTPRLQAEVREVPAAAVTDPQSGESFYRVTLSVTPEELDRLGSDIALIPGMPVEAFLQTGGHSVMAFLLHPISSHLNRAFRES
ncbi:HlyD family type I secretion periplasmic adaptor subunit [Rubellimicrobium roseum]|uniref:Membrane fusion protein (MFP) family protein n=1 Tax=Rubellimicrobium roseum TaxID=687525 RepID=A0A5C4NJM5_9RHOB|nr:HlyD family type I secretion periplasmic adaptor subunit [Rubellimicrobium roseum]TNC74783.1 HlyD family type I secretion periplasmic adaptor subunit [Rubellimicrobium roseum]